MFVNRSMCVSVIVFFLSVQHHFNCFGTGQFHRVNRTNRFNFMKKSSEWKWNGHETSERKHTKNNVNYIQQQYTNTNSVGMVKKGTINTGHSIYHDTNSLQLYPQCAPICSLLVSLLPGCHSGCVSIFIEKYNIRFGNQIYHVLELYKWISISYQSRRLLISLTPEMSTVIRSMVAMFAYAGKIEQSASCSYPHLNCKMWWNQLYISTKTPRYIFQLLICNTRWVSGNCIRTALHLPVQTAGWLDFRKLRLLCNWIIGRWVV